MYWNSNEKSVQIKNYGTDDMYAIIDIELRIKPNGDVTFRHYNSVTDKDIYLFTDTCNSRMFDECHETITMEIFLKRIMDEYNENL